MTQVLRTSPAQAPAPLPAAQATTGTKFSSIRNPLIIALVLIVLIPTTFTSIFSAVTGLQSRRAQAEYLLDAVSASKIAQIRLWIGDGQAIVNAALGDPSVNWILPVSGFPELRGDSALRFRSRFEKLIADSQFFEAMFLMDKDGIVRLSTDKTLEGQSLKHRVDLSKVQTGDVIAAPKVATDAEPNVLFLHPETDRAGKLLAIVGGKASLAQLEALMASRSGLGETGETYLVDSASTLLTSAANGEIAVGSRTLESPQVRTVLTSGSPYLGSLIGLEGSGQIASVNPVPELSMAIVTVQDETEVFSSTFQTLAGNVVLSLLAMVVVAYVGLRAANQRLIAPLQKLSDAARQVAAKNLTAKTDVEQDDELGLLAHTFNDMTDQLRESIDTLEDRVAKRTAELAQAQRQSEQANRAKSVFLSNMSHELRTPLNVVIGYSSSMLTRPQMFNGMPVSDVHRPFLQLIEENGHYLLGLINDMLDLSKIEAGKLELKRTHIALPDIFRGVIATSLGLLKSKPVQLRQDFPDNLPEVWADSMRVRQIILNLMSNAIKFTDSGSVTLSATVEGGFVRIAVSDTGIGIPESVLPTIFDRYQQAQQSPDKHYGGTGLGLDISKQLSRMHGGDLKATSVVGQGSTFWFTLPIATPEQLHLDAPAAHPDEGVKVYTPAKATTPVYDEVFTVLLVESDMARRESLRQALEAESYVVFDASDNDVGLELAIGVLPNLIVWDINHPTATPTAFLQALQNNPDTADVPVVLFTEDQSAFKVNGTAAEKLVAARLSKSATAQQMLQTIKGILQRKPDLTVVP
jgi:signal transduction histidine kinase